MWAAMWAGLVAIIVPLAKKLLVGLGFGIVTYGAVATFLDAAGDLIQSQLTGLPVLVATLLGLARVDECVSIILAAHASALALHGLSRLRFVGS